MLLPKLAISQPADNRAALRLEDITPDYNELRFPGGFGGINPARDDVRITMTLRSASRMFTGMDETTLPPALFTSAGKFDLNKQFSDGVYQLTLRAYGDTGVPVSLCDYLMPLVPWQTGYRLDVLAGSAWVDVTADAVVQKSTDGSSGTIHWQALQTAVTYSLWRLTALSTGLVVNQGSLSPSGCQPSTTQTGVSGSELLISSQDYQLLLLGGLEAKIAQLAVSLAREQVVSLATHVLARQGAFATLYYGYEQIKHLSPAASPYALEQQLAGLHRQADRLASAQSIPVR